MIKTLAHIAYGLLAGLVSVAYPAVAALYTLIFLSYQAFDYLNGKRGGARETLEYAVGFAAGFIIQTLFTINNILYNSR